LLQTQEKLLRTLQVRVDRHERCANCNERSIAGEAFVDLDTAT
jgi:hypothetical protein